MADGQPSSSLAIAAQRTVDRLPAARWAQLGAVALTQILAMGLWFSAAAVVADLQTEWQLSAGEAVWLTISVQIGFVAGALGAAALNLSDILPARRLIAAGALCGAMATAAVVLWAEGLALAIPLRLLAGAALACVYPPGIKLLATWFQRERGLAMGVLVGALSVGSGAPYLINAVAAFSWQYVLTVASGMAVGAAVLALTVLREGPLAAPTPRLYPGYAVKMFRDPSQRRVNFGYFGHMWELYAVWGWLPVYLAASYAAWQPGGDHRLAVGLVAFASIALAGFFGCVLAGLFADRRSRASAAIWSLAVSGGCCLLSAISFGQAPALVAAVVLLWGTAIIADSAQYSAGLSELAEPRYVGTALTVQMAVGFLLTVASLRLVPAVAEGLGWRYAFVPLVAGPIVGIWSMARLAASGALPSRQ